MHVSECSQLGPMSPLFAAAWRLHDHKRRSPIICVFVLSLLLKRSSLLSWLGACEWLHVSDKHMLVVLR